MRERRMVVYRDGFYQLLKLKDSNGRWHNYGKRTSLQGICSIADSERFDLVISEEIVNDVRRYREEKAKRSIKYRNISYQK